LGQKENWEVIGVKPGKDADTPGGGGCKQELTKKGGDNPGKQVKAGEGNAGRREFRL